MAQDGKITFAFDGGIDGQAIADIVQPPEFVACKNVRLSYERGAPVKSPLVSDITSLTSLGFRCSSVIPHAASGTAYFGMDTPVRATDVSTARVQRHDGQALGYGVSRPLKITAAGGTMPGRSVCPPSIALAADGGRWVAQIKQRVVRSFGSSTFDGTLGLYVSYTDAEGRVVIASKHVCDVESGVWGVLGVPSWASITAHGAGAIVWYRTYAGATIRPLYARTLSLTGSTLTVGAETAIASPSNACYVPAVYSLGGSEAWVSLPVSSTVLRTMRVSSSLSVLGTLDQTPGTSLDNASCSLWVHPTTSAAVATCVSSATEYMLLFDSSSMTLTESTAASGPGLFALCTALYVSSSEGAADFYGVAYSAGAQAMPNGSTSTTAYPKTRIKLKPVGLSVAASTLELPHLRLACSYSATDTHYIGPDVTGEIFGVLARSAYIALTPWYGPYTVETDRAYVTDPALLIASVWVDTDSVVRVGWHARVAVDRIQSRVSGVPEGIGPSGFCFAGASMQLVGGQMAVGYLERNEATNLNNEAGLGGRFVQFDVGSHQPPVAAVGSALTLSGGSLPLYWDGVELSEQMPLVRPVIMISTGGSGTATDAYTVSYIAVVYWRDAQGLLHRSAPSLPVASSVGVGDAYPDILVTVPPSLHDDGVCTGAIVRLYSASAGAGASSVYRLMSSAPDGRKVNGCWRFAAPNGVLAASSSSPALYADGLTGEIIPEPMPPSQDVVVALDRVFCIDAESRSDVWYSKPLEPGISPEFSGALKVTFPAQAGALIALAEIAGQLIAIGDAGVATLYGDGPDSAGNGGFGPPRLISRQGGTTREAVGRYPGGVIYLGGDGRWQRIDGQGAAPMPKAPIPASAVRGWTLIANGSELAFWLDGIAHVYNYALDRWHTWEWAQATVGDASYPIGVLASENDSSTTAWMCRTVPSDTPGFVGHFVSRLDGGATSSDQAFWQTGWLIPPGDQQQDVEWSEVVVHAIHQGSHGLVIRVDSDFGASGMSTTRTWTSSEITALVSGDRYTVGVKVAHRKARSLRVRIQETDATGTAFRPVSCTVYFSLANSQARRPLKPGAEK